MDPDTFVRGEEISSLTALVETFLGVYYAANQRLSFLKDTAHVHPGFYSSVNLNDSPLLLSSVMAGNFRAYRVPASNPDYHPLVSFTEAILSNPGLAQQFDDQQNLLLERLLQRGQENLKAIRARTSVGRIESPLGTGLGTAAYVGKNLLLTSRHVFGANIYQAWVRFGYKVGSIGLEEVHKLDLNFASAQSQPDYALVRIDGPVNTPPAAFEPKVLTDGNDPGLRMIHHPGGKPATVSDPGRVVQAGMNYIDHDISTQPGSSGAPLFDLDWVMVAIHRGNPGVGRAVQPGTTEAVPLSAIWNSISGFLV